MRAKAAWFLAAAGCHLQDGLTVSLIRMAAQRWGDRLLCCPGRAAHPLYALFAEVRDQGLRRWRILERLDHMPESRQSLVTLLMEADGEIPDAWELQREKRKRRESLND
jgi:hypothetical protein